MAGSVDVFELGIGDAREGDAHRGVAGGAVGAAEVDGVLAEGLVEGVDGVEEFVAGFFLGGREEIAGVLRGGQEAVEDDADIQERLGGVGGGSAGPECV